MKTDHACQRLPILQLTSSTRHPVSVIYILRTIPHALSLDGKLYSKVFGLEGSSLRGCGLRATPGAVNIVTAPRLPLPPRLLGRHPGLVSADFHIRGRRTHWLVCVVGLGVWCGVCFGGWGWCVVVGVGGGVMWSLGGSAGGGVRAGAGGRRGGGGGDGSGPGRCWSAAAGRDGGDHVVRADAQAPAGRGLGCRAARRAPRVSQVRRDRLPSRIEDGIPGRVLSWPAGGQRRMTGSPAAAGAGPMVTGQPGVVSGAGPRSAPARGGGVRAAVRRALTSSEPSGGPALRGRTRRRLPARSAPVAETAEPAMERAAVGEVRGPGPARTSWQPGCPRRGSRAGGGPPPGGGADDRDQAQHRVCRGH